MKRSQEEQWLLTEEQIRADKTENPSFSFARRKASAADVVWALDKLATTENAGLPIFRSLEVLASMRKGEPIGKVLSEMHNRLGEGASLTVAFREQETTFGPLVCALIEAADRAGGLETTLTRAARLTESRLRLRRKIRAGLVYPITVAVVAIILVLALLIFVIPQFEQIYASAGGELPALTRVLVSLSDMAPFVAAVVALLALAGWLTVRASRNNKALRLTLDRFNLKVPLTGKLVRKGVNARIASTLSSLLSTGLPPLEALDYAASAANNLVYANALDEVKNHVRDGMALSAALEAAPEGVFPPLMVQLTKVGEESSAVPELMEKYAIDAEEEVNNTAESLTRLIEPLMIVVLGSIIGVFVIGLYLPILEVGNQIN